MKPILLLVSAAIVFIIFPNKNHAQWSSNPQINLQVVNVQNAQTFSKIAATSDGGCFISWFDTRDNGRYKVYIQRLNAQGFKQFANDGLLVSDKPQNTWFGDYDLEVDGSDNALLVFADIRNAFMTDTIANPFVYKISSTGQFLWGADGVTLTTNYNNYQVWPKVASLSDGSAIVVWWFINTAEHNSWITMQKLNSAGVPQFAQPINIQDPGNKRYQYPDVCAAENGNFILSWAYGPKDTVGSFVPDNITVFTNKYDPSGSPLWGANQVVYTAPNNTIPIYCVPRIYTDHSGGALYSYFNSTPTGLFSRAQHFNSSGTPLFPANGSEGSTRLNYIHVEPYVAYMTSTNETFMFWTEADSGPQSRQSIYGQKFSSSGSRLWGDDGLAFSPNDTVSIYGIYCFAYDTNVVVTHTTVRFGVEDGIISAARVNRNGSTVWNTIMCDVLSSKDYVVATMTNAGMVINSWLDSRGTQLGRGGIYAQNVNYNGTIGPIGIFQISSIVPESFSLSQNFPNPFNNSTSIEFDIRETGIYSMEVFDMTGKKVDEVFRESKTPGTYRVNYNTGVLSSGVYLYKLSSESNSIVRKFVMVK